MAILETAKGSRVIVVFERQRSTYDVSPTDVSRESSVNPDPIYERDIWLITGEETKRPLTVSSNRQGPGGAWLASSLLTL